MIAYNQIVSGRPATIAYLTADFEPADENNYVIMKVLFDDGDSTFLLSSNPARRRAAMLGVDVNGEAESAGWNRHRAKHQRPHVTPPVDDAAAEAAAWGRHRTKHQASYVTSPVDDGEAEASGWRRHRDKHSRTVHIGLPMSATLPAVKQLAVWGQAVNIIDTTEVPVRHLIETSLAGITQLGDAMPLMRAHKIVNGLMNKITAIRTAAFKKAFQAVHSKIGNVAIVGVSLDGWGVAILRADIISIRQAIQSGLASGLDNMEIARNVVGTMAMNGIDGATQYTRQRVVNLGGTSISKRGKTR